MTAEPIFWTQLPPLELRGLGTPLVESLQHYCARMAWVTGLPLQEIWRMTYTDDCETKSAFLRGSICGPGENFVARVRVLERLTGNSTLRHGTFWVLKDVLGSRSIGEGRNRRWCPECYAVWDASGSAEPLIWRVALLSSCPKHGCAMEESCTKCGSKQPAMTTLERSHICISCRSPLAGRGGPVIRSDFYQWVDRQIEQLLELCARPGQAAVAGEAFTILCDGLRMQASAHSTFPIAYRRLIHSSARSVKSKTSRPSLRTLINLCALQGVSVCDALLRPEEAASRPLLDLWSGFHAMPVPPRVSRRWVDVATTCLFELLQLLEKRYLPPMEAVLRPLKVLRAVVRDVDPDIYELYAHAYKAQGTDTELLYARKAFEFGLKLIREGDERCRGRPAPKSLTRRIARKFGHDESVAERYSHSAIQFDKVMRDAMRWNPTREATRIETYTEWLKGN